MDLTLSNGLDDRMFPISFMLTALSTLPYGWYIIAWVLSSLRSHSASLASVAPWGMMTVLGRLMMFSPDPCRVFPLSPADPGS